MNKELFKVLNENKWIVEFLANCHGILIRMKEICCWDCCVGKIVVKKGLLPRNKKSSTSKYKQVVSKKTLIN